MGDKMAYAVSAFCLGLTVLAVGVFVIAVYGMIQDALK